MAYGSFTLRVVVDGAKAPQEGVNGEVALREVGLEMDTLILEF